MATQEQSEVLLNQLKKAPRMKYCGLFKNTIAQGGKYIKVVADLPRIMGGGIMEQTVLEEIVKCAHENDLKIAVHAISVAGVQMAADAGIDMLIHIPIGETFPQELAEQIVKQGIEVMPTLAMMQAFADSSVYGYKKADYQDAVAAVQLLHSMNVPILVATDSSDTFFVPQLKHGETLQATALKKQLLESCYYNSLLVAVKKGIRTVDCCCLFCYLPYKWEVS